jgi:cardiolipin synthase
MVDKLGQITDEPRHMLNSHRILDELCVNGVQVAVFHPAVPGLSPRVRLHSKFCAIDGDTLFIGGSNIGDYYTTWSDTNLRVDGQLGNTLHEVYDHLHALSMGGDQLSEPWHFSNLHAGDDHLVFTVPGQQEIRQSLLNLIKTADRSIHLRVWYFLPDAEILEALCTQAKRGVQVNVMLSDRTRLRPIDLANTISIHQLIRAGGNVYRYTGTYMHAKTAWNNRGTILLGSANLDHQSMAVSIESCLEMQDPDLVFQLQRAFVTDQKYCLLQTSSMYQKRSLLERSLSQVCNLVSPWM